MIKDTKDFIGKEEEEVVEIIEIWQPVENGGEAVRFATTEKGKPSLNNLKRIALIVGGTPFHLEKDYVMERRQLTEEEAKRLPLPKTIYE